MPGTDFTELFLVALYFSLRRRRDYGAVEVVVVVVVATTLNFHTLHG